MLQNPSVCRGGTPCEPASVDEAVYCAVHHSAASPKTIADALEINYAHLMAAADPHRTDSHVQARWLVGLMRVTDNLLPLRYLAAALDCAIVTLPRVTREGAAIYERLADVVRELGEDSAVIQHVLEDGHVTAEEVLLVEREIADTVEALLAVREEVRARARDLAKPAAAKMALPSQVGQSSASAATRRRVGA